MLAETMCVMEFVPWNTYGGIMGRIMEGNEGAWCESLALS